MTAYAAGWNQVGYSPNPDHVYVTDDWQRAVEYLADTIERWWDEDYEMVAEKVASRESIDATYLDAHTALHNAPSGPEFSLVVHDRNGGPWTLWIQETEEPDEG